MMGLECAPCLILAGLLAWVIAGSKLFVQVLTRMKSILRVTRIFRLMRLVKLFQMYLVREPMHVPGMPSTYRTACAHSISLSKLCPLCPQIYRENLKFEEQSGIKTSSRSAKDRPW